MSAEPLTRTERRLYLSMKRFCFGKDHTIASQETLADDLKVSVPTVKRATAGLVKKGWISTERRGNSTVKKTILGDPSRRARKPGITYQMQFNLIPRAEKSDPPDDPPDDPPIYNSLEASPGSQTKKPLLLKTRPAKETMATMPEMYANDPAAQKLWRMAQRWIALNSPDLTAVPGDKATPIMYALEAAGALNLPEDGPLPMITWPGLEEIPLVKLAEAVERKPMRSTTPEDYEFLRRKIDQQ